MSVRNPCIHVHNVQVSRGKFHRGHFYKAAVRQTQTEVGSTHLFGLSSKRTRNKGGREVSKFVVVKQWINCESLLCDVILEMSSLITHSHLQQKGRKWKEQGKWGEEWCYWRRPGLSLKIMSVLWRIMNTHYVSINSNIVASDETGELQLYPQLTASLLWSVCDII